MFLLQDFLQRGVLSMEEARCVVLFCPKTWDSQEVISPLGPSPIDPKVKFLALDEADRMLDMGTLAYFGKFF